LRGARAFEGDPPSYREALSGYEKRLTGLHLSKGTIGIYLIMARRFMEYLDGRQIDAAALAAYRDEVAPDLNPNTWRGYVHGLNSFLRYLGLDLRLDPPNVGVSPCILFML